MVKLLNNMVAIFVIVIVFLLIIPLPVAVLDFMFIANLTISFVILLTSMYIKESLEFSIFPSLLLITTLFRLGLNVSSTRAILQNGGYAGEVIQTFGNFVIRGNVVVGLVIFLIIVLVQFIVITKGSERVAEVAARFTLDAMPGKQMAIDADLSSGLITEDEARLRRSNIQREADFFGAMDGASKFVKGDAIISLVVTLINLIGGLLVGFMAGGSFQDVVNTYATATVGDGLMSQIPALLISVSTGMIVTRSASQSTLNDDVLRQFTSQPMTLIIAAIAMMFLIPIGFPPLQVLAVSALLITVGLTTLRKMREPVAALAGGPPDISEEVTSEADYYRDIDNVYNLLTVDPVSMEFGYSLIPLVDSGSGGTFVDRVVMFRKHFAVDMGMVFPSVRIMDSGQLNPNQYAINIKGERVAVGEVLVDHFLALAPSDGEDLLDGIETVEPAFGIPAKWISADKQMKAELAGYTLIDPTSVIITHLSEVIKAHAHEMLNRQEVNNILTNLKKTNEALVEDTVPAIITLSSLQKILASLLREGVPIKDIETILETVAEYGGSIRDMDMLIEYIRQALRRTITHRFAEAGQLKVISLDTAIENQIMASVKKVDGGSYLALEPQVIQKIITATTAQLDKIRDLVQVPVILTSPIVRVYFKKLVDEFYLNCAVLSFNEVDAHIKIQALGNITIT